MFLVTNFRVITKQKETSYTGGHLTVRLMPTCRYAGRMASTKGVTRY